MINLLLKAAPVLGAACEVGLGLVPTMPPCEGLK
jgi:hypothetical protein